MRKPIRPVALLRLSKGRFDSAALVLLSGAPLPFRLQIGNAIQWKQIKIILRIITTFT